MQREHLRRGFTIHQKVVLEIDFSGSIWGYTELTVVPQTKDLRTIHLHSRQCTIHSVTVASHSADFVHHDPLANISVSNPQDCHNHLELKRKLYSALAEGDEGELSIAIPREVVKQSGHSVAGVVSEAATPEPQTPGPSLQTSAPQPEFVPIVVCITYSLRNPSDGLQFVVPNDTYPFRVPHMYTSPSSPDAARCWVPCIDNLWEKCTWEFEFVVPRHLEQHDALSDDEDEDSQEVDYPTVVVCSGELVEQVSHPHNSAKTIFVFAQSTLTSVQHIAFAAGPFHVHTIPADLSTAEDASGTTQPLMHAFCLPGHEAMLSQSVSCMRSAMSFYSSEFGSYPFGSHKLVFVDELPTQRFDSATLSLVTVDLLHGDDAIDQVFEARHSLGHALACQWIGINIVQKTWSDTWLVNGLGLYITGLFMRKVFGNNEYRFRLKKDMERVVEMDMGAMPPICQPQCLDPPDSFTLPFVNIKAPLVLHILDRRLGKSGTSLGLSRVLPKIFLSAISGEMPNNAISTHAFLRTCRKVSGIDPRSFAEQWIYGSGCPVFGFSATFNRKKMAVEITMRQDAPAYKVLENNEINKTLLKPVPFFEGQMTIRIHEADGTPYEHVLDIRSPVKRYEVPFNTKYKRVRRNTKRYLARQQAAQAAAEGDAEAAAAMDMVDMGFGLDIWEKEKERENWKVADWTEEDEQNMSGQTYEWIRIDADFEWIAAIAFDQKDYMWVSQLQRDRDVVAQYEAISVLAKNPSAIISSNFTRTVLVTNYYYRIRCEAALALVTCAVQRLDWLGLFHLFKLFLRYCYEPDDPNQDLFTHSYVPRPNDFSDFAEYFVRKSLVQAISRVRFGNGKTPPVVRQFLIDQLRYNDNTSNSFSDALYICTVISSLTCAIVSTVPPERGEFIDTESRPALDAEDANLLRQAVTEIDRYRSMDRLIPSPHNVVTVATIEFYLTLGLASLVPLDPRIFFPMTREGNFTQVRMAAFDALFLCKWYTTKVMQYVLAVMAHDSSRVIRRHVARNACQSLALLVTMGEMKTSVKESESLLIEEDGTPQENKKESKKSDMDIVIKALRKDREVGKNEVIREFLIPIAMAPDADIEVRWCLLKLADLLIRPSEEVPPKVTIHLPPTPVVETPPALPKVSLKTHKALKSATPSIMSPLTPFTIPPKLKLPPSAPNADALMRAPSTASTPTVDRKAPTFTVPKPPKKVTDKVPLIAKPPAPKKVPQARTSGMSQSDLSACRTAVKKMQTNKSAAVFLQPVDPIRDRAPNYFDIIKNPMDISTMSAKLEQGQYKDRFAFEADFRLMIANAKQYNMPMSFVHNEAVKLEAFFDKLWVRINKTLEAADKAHAKSVSVPIATSVTPRPTVPSRAIATPIPQTPTPASSRPIIKLKVGGASLNGSPAPTPSETAQLPLPRPKLKKVKEKPSVESHASTSETAYFDDGSADLLEEVIAIEREKSAERRLAKERSKEQERPKEKEKVRDHGGEKSKEPAGIPKLVIGKRKKPSTESKTSEDEILSLAAPAKKERSSSYTPPIAGPSTIPAKLPEPSKSSTSTSGSGRNSLSSHKTKEKPQKVPTAPLPLAPEPVPAQEVPRISIKGKEKDKGRDREKEKEKERGKEREKDKSKEKEKDRSKEREKEKEKEKEKEPVHSPPSVVPKKKSPPQVNTPAKSKGSSSSTPSPAATPINEKKCREVLKILMKLPDARIFLIPVDPVRDGCPTYYDEIKNPMDFGSMSTKLTEHAYVTMEEFAADVDLIFKNCRTFNPPTTYPVNCADALDRVFKKEWAKAMEKKLAWNEKRSLQSIMNKLVQDPISWVFREPVDPVLLGIPTYHDVIPKSKARDLKTIRQKLEIDKYDTVEAFEADLDLMINNAILFNGAESEVGKIAKLVRDKYRELLSSVRTTTSTKRKSEKGTPQPSKKQKMS